MDTVNSKNDKLIRFQEELQQRGPVRERSKTS